MASQCWHLHRRNHDVAWGCYPQPPLQITALKSQMAFEYIRTIKCSKMFSNMFKHINPYPQPHHRSKAGRGAMWWGCAPSSRVERNCSEVDWSGGTKVNRPHCWRGNLYIYIYNKKQKKMKSKHSWDSCSRLSPVHCAAARCIAVGQTSWKIVLYSCWLAVFFLLSLLWLFCLLCLLCFTCLLCCLVLLCFALLAELAVLAGCCWEVACNAFQIPLSRCMELDVEIYECVSRLLVLCCPPLTPDWAQGWDLNC